MATILELGGKQNNEHLKGYLTHTWNSGKVSVFLLSLEDIKGICSRKRE